MNIQELSKNIKNAFEVVDKTFDNIFKLYVSIDDELMKDGYTSITPKFLRSRSDVNPESINIKDLIKLYQNKNDKIQKKNDELKEGPIFSIETSILDDFVEQPTIIISKYIYDFIRPDHQWETSPKVSDWWGFYDPIREKEYLKDKVKNFEYIEIPRNVQERYWHLQKIYFKKIPLVEVKDVDDIKIKIIQPINELYTDIIYS